MAAALPGCDICTQFGFLRLPYDTDDTRTCARCSEFVDAVGKGFAPGGGVSSKDAFLALATLKGNELQGTIPASPVWNRLLGINNGGNDADLSLYLKLFEAVCRRQRWPVQRVRVRGKHEADDGERVVHSTGRLTLKKSDGKSWN